METRKNIISSSFYQKSAYNSKVFLMHGDYCKFQKILMIYGGCLLARGTPLVPRATVGWNLLVSNWCKEAEKWNDDKCSSSKKYSKRHFFFLSNSCSLLSYILCNSVSLVVCLAKQWDLLTYKCCFNIVHCFDFFLSKKFRKKEKMAYNSKKKSFFKKKICVKKCIKLQAHIIRIQSFSCI